MNCLEFHRQCFINPGNNDDAFIKHLNSCNACAEFYSQIEHTEKNLVSALEIMVPENLKSGIMLRQSMQNNKQPYRAAYYAFAASLLIATIITFMFTWHTRNPGLEDIVITYVEGVHTNDNNSANLNHVAVADILRPLGMTLSSDFGPVQSARPCTIRGKDAAHIVVAGQFGTIDIIYMPTENIGNRFELKQKENKLVLVPCPKGSLAIYGSSNEQLTDVETRFQAASQWL